MNRAFTCLRCRAAGGPRARGAWLRGFAAGMGKRPPTAPKPMLDIKHIYENAELYEATCAARNYPRQAAHPRRIQALYRQLQESQRDGRLLREQSNRLRKLLANPATSSGDDDVSDLRHMSREQWLEQARQLKGQLSVVEKGEAAARAEMEALALELPNLTSDDAPKGREPVVLGYINEEPRFDESADEAVWRSHVHIGAELGLLDFAGAAAASGWGWYYLVGEAAQLEQALVQYALAVATRRGWTQVAPPSVVYSHIGAACGFRPRDQHGEQQVYTLAQAQADADRGVPELCLAGTSEIALAGMKANATLDAESLPMRRVAASRCYRAEAGARGADTKGLYRVHEFTKVELFAWTAPDEAEARRVHAEMLEVQREILSSLGLWCRVLSMPAADLGASATLKVDVEAFFPSRRHHGLGHGGWGEVTSASLCGDYQARRLATRTRADGRMTFPFTANGTALAVPRVLAALLENGWDRETGTVAVPPCLRPWMGGKEAIGARERDTAANDAAAAARGEA